MPLKTVKIENFTWVNIKEPDEKDIEYLKENYKFHQLDYQDILGETQLPKIDVYKYYIFLIIYLPVIKKKLDNIEMDVFAGEDFLVTVQKKKIKIVDSLFKKVSEDERFQKKLSSRGSGYILYKLMDPLFKSYYSKALRSMSNEVTKVENEIYDKQVGKETLEQLTAVRRLVLDMRRTVSLERFIIDNLLYAKKEFIIQKEYNVYIDDMRDYMEKVWAILDDNKNIVDGLFETNESMISLRTNEVIKILTIISVALLPLTLLAGIYGMNIPGLPYINDPEIIFLIFVILFTLIVGLIVIYKRRGFL